MDAVKSGRRSRRGAVNTVAVLSMVAAATFGATAVGVTAAGATTLTPVPGTAAFTSGSTVLAYRFRSHVVGGGSSMLVGVSPLLLPPSNSNGALSSPSTGPYGVTFSSNPTGDSGSVTPTTPVGMVSTSYTVSPFPTGLNTLQIILTANSGDTVSFTGITVNGNTVPDQTVTGGIDAICIPNLSLQSFTIGGTFTRTSEARTGNTNMVDLAVGAGSCSPNGGATPEFPAPILAPLAIIVVGGAAFLARRRRFAHR